MLRRRRFGGVKMSNESRFSSKEQKAKRRLLPAQCKQEDPGDSTPVNLATAVWETYSRVLQNKMTEAKKERRRLAIRETKPSRAIYLKPRL